MIKRLKQNKKIYIITIILLSIIGISSWVYFNSKSDIELKYSTGNIKIKYTNKYTKISANLVKIEQSDIWNNNNLIIVSGEIQSIQNITIDMNGEEFYNAIVKIKPNHFIKGNVEQDDQIVVLVGCSVGDKEIWQENTFVNASMKVGDSIIAMISKMGDEDILECNGSKLIYKELANYRFNDAMRYCFIENSEGEIIYAKHLYNDLIDPKSLTEVENYISGKIK